MSKKHVKNPEKSHKEKPRSQILQSPEIPGPLAFDWRTAQPELLSKELRTYQTALDRLLLQKDDYVLIKGEEIVGTYPTRELALNEAVDRFGAERVLIKRIVESEPILEIGHVIF